MGASTDIDAEILASRAPIFSSHEAKETWAREQERQRQERAAEQARLDAEKLAKRKEVIANLDPSHWVVIGSANEYSDRTEWVTGICLTQNEAELWVTLLTARRDQIRASTVDLWNIHEWTDEGKAIWRRLFLALGDPGLLAMWDMGVNDWQARNALERAEHTRWKAEPGKLLSSGGPAFGEIPGQSDINKASEI